MPSPLSTTPVESQKMASQSKKMASRFALKLVLFSKGSAQQKTFTLEVVLNDPLIAFLNIILMIWNSSCYAATTTHKRHSVQLY